MSDFTTDPAPDYVRPGVSHSRDEIYRHRAEIIAQEIRRGVESEDARDEPDAAMPDAFRSRPRAAPSRAVAETTPTINMFGTTLPIDDPRVAHFAATGAMLPQTRHELQQMVQRQNNRTLKDLGDQYPDVFSNHGRARLAAIHAADIRQADAARGVVRGDREVFFQAAAATRKDLRGKKSR
jgi:hypothetical protein